MDGHSKSGEQSGTGAGYRLPSLEKSEIVIIDTPGINEVGGADRAQLAEVTARQADLILFVTDSDLNDTEYAALVELAAIQKPILLVFNKTDLYTPAVKATLIETLKVRIDGLIPPDHLVLTAADPREIEYAIEQPRWQHAIRLEKTRARDQRTEAVNPPDT